jgi:signal transduction histidine kinase
MREAFWQWDQSKWVDQWFGLWLPLVKSLCDQLWYTIRVASSPGTGTSFSIYFTG